MKRRGFGEMSSNTEILTVEVTVSQNPKSGNKMSKFDDKMLCWVQRWEERFRDSDWSGQLVPLCSLYRQLVLWVVRGGRASDVRARQGWGPPSDVKIEHYIINILVWTDWVSNTIARRNNSRGWTMRLMLGSNSRHLFWFTDTVRVLGIFDIITCKL